MKKALYRAYRPQTFDEVLGQDAIVQVLKNQVQSGSPGHAYLFAGVRGTGKTSCAKILSRAVNCLNPQNGNPCNECAHCKAILNETTMDVVEMDAASNRRIDDIRELREKVVYPPVDLKYKVYIIDEAHMITNEGFNALLKIMEEPPEHLIFILATTELEKIPETIRSRVQRYAFRRIGQADVEKNLLRIAQQAGYQLDVDAAASIASHANGAMRDALSALDQLLGDKEHIGIEQVHEILGTVGLTPILSLWNAIFHDDAKQALEQLQFLFQEGKEAHSVYEEMIRILRLSILRKAGVLEGQESDGQETQLRALIQEVGMDRLLDSMDILMQSEEMSKRSEYAQVLLESCVLRLVDYVDQGQLKSRIAALESKLEIVERWTNPRAAIRQELPDLLAEALETADLSCLYEKELDGPKQDGDHALTEQKHSLSEIENVRMEQAARTSLNASHAPDTRKEKSAEAAPAIPRMSPPSSSAEPMVADTGATKRTRVKKKEQPKKIPLQEDDQKRTQWWSEKQSRVTRVLSERLQITPLLIQRMLRMEEKAGVVYLVFSQKESYIADLIRRKQSLVEECLRELSDEIQGVFIGSEQAVLTDQQVRWEAQQAAGLHSRERASEEADRRDEIKRNVRSAAVAEEQEERTLIEKVEAKLREKIPSELLQIED